MYLREKLEEIEQQNESPADKTSKELAALSKELAAKAAKAAAAENQSLRVEMARLKKAAEAAEAKSAKAEAAKVETTGLRAEIARLKALLDSEAQQWQSRLLGSEKECSKHVDIISSRLQSTKTDLSAANKQVDGLQAQLALSRQDVFDLQAKLAAGSAYRGEENAKAQALAEGQQRLLEDMRDENRKLGEDNRRLSDDNRRVAELARRAVDDMKAHVCPTAAVGGGGGGAGAGGAGEGDRVRGEDRFVSDSGERMIPLARHRQLTEEFKAAWTKEELSLLSRIKELEDALACCLSFAKHHGVDFPESSETVLALLSKSDDAAAPKKEQPQAQQAQPQEQPQSQTVMS
jgi:hypothetical protein